MMDGRGPRRSATAYFRGEAEEIPRLEDFVRGLRFLSPPERDRLLIVSTEIMENLISYAGLREGSRIIARAASHGDAGVIFWFKGDKFREFAMGSALAESAATTRAPYFDPVVRRYRGLGLGMCSRLAKSVRYRSGDSLDAVIVKL